LLQILLFSLIAMQASLPTLVVEEINFKTDLSQYVEVYEDPSAAMSVSEINEKYNQGEFFRVENNTLSFGLSSSAYWFRFSVEDRTKRDYPLLLDIGSPMLNQVNLYSGSPQQAGEYTQVQSPPQGRKILFPLHSAENVSRTYYLQVNSDAPIRVPLTLSTPSEYRNQVAVEHLILGAFYGICLGLGLFNLFLFFSTREASYLCYVLFVASTVAYNVVVDGFFDVSMFNGRFIIVSLIAFQISAIANLMRAFFELGSSEPLLDKLCKFTSIGALSVIPLALVFGADAFIGPIHVFLLPAGLLLLVVSLSRWRAGFTSAIYFLAAWVGLVTVVAALSLDLLGVISLNYSAYGLKIGILSQLLLFSFALGDRLNGLNKSLGAEIERRAKNEFALQKSEKRWRGFSEAAFEGVLIFEDGLVKEVNPSLVNMLGESSDFVVGTSGEQLVVSDYVDAVRDWVASGAKEPIELELRREDGSHFFAELNSRSESTNEDLGTVRVVAVRDVTLRKSHEDKLRKMAQYDVLTGLPNRSLFNERANHALTAAKRKDKIHAVLFLDLDRFKNVNDSLGHSVGDELLVEIAQRLSSGTRPEDTVARLGGDEFAILLEDISAPRVAAKVAQKIIDQLMDPVAIAGHELVTTPSIGIALYPDNGATVEDLLRNADTAMYRAKSNGRNCYQFFTRDMDNQMLHRLKLESDLRHALQYRHFMLHFQPQICFTTGEVMGAEALVRWDAGLNGLRFPGEFIGVAEETGLIVPLGEQVIEMACEQLAIWNSQGIRLPHLSINLSSKQFCYTNIVPSIFSKISPTRKSFASFNLFNLSLSFSIA